MISLLQLIEDNFPTNLGYTPKLKQIAGSIEAAIMLNEMIRLFNLNGCKPFFRFDQPCQNMLCEPGESWAEVLGYSKAEVTRAKSLISRKVSPKLAFNEIANSHDLVLRWTVPAGVTLYWVNLAEIARRYEGLK